MPSHSHRLIPQASNPKPRVEDEQVPVLETLPVFSVPAEHAPLGEHQAPTEK